MREFRIILFILSSLLMTVSCSDKKELEPTTVSQEVPTPDPSPPDRSDATPNPESILDPVLPNNPPPPLSLSPADIYGLISGGSNYPMITVGSITDYVEDTDPFPWFDQDNLQPVLGYYHHRPNRVRSQLEQMDQQGQKAISLILWYIPDPQPDPNTYTYGHALYLQGNDFPVQVQENLLNVIDIIDELGFNQVNIRFAPQGSFDPIEWSSWQDDLFERSWNLAYNTIKRIEAHPKEIKVMYDLGLELGGRFKGQNREWMDRMWKNYVFNFNSYDSYGFSMIAQPGNILRSVSLYDDAGARPSAFAIDVYQDISDRLREINSELKEIGEWKKPIIIQETYYNDLEIAEEIFFRGERLGLNIVGIHQWPLHKNHVNHYFSVDFPVDFNNYLGRPRIVDSGFGCDNQECVWIVAENISRDAFAILTDRNGNSLEVRDVIIETREDHRQVMTFRIPYLDDYKSMGGFDLSVYEPNFIESVKASLSF